jgi:hypothetical protein
MHFSHSTMTLRSEGGAGPETAIAQQCRPDIRPGSFSENSVSRAQARSDLPKLGGRGASLAILENLSVDSKLPTSLVSTIIGGVTCRRIFRPPHFRKSNGNYGPRVFLSADCGNPAESINSGQSETELRCSRSSLAPDAGPVARNRAPPRLRMRRLPVRPRYEFPPNRTGLTERNSTCLCSAKRLADRHLGIWCACTQPITTP